MNDDLKSGTPSTLDDAVTQALCVGPVSEIRDRSYCVLRDFMAQKFSVAMLKSDDEGTTKILEDLFRELTKREKSALRKE